MTLVGLLLIYLAIVNKYSPMLNVDGIGLGEPYVAIDATARVPTRIGLIGVINTNSYHILSLVLISPHIRILCTFAPRKKAR